jgi:hypothetical protein
MTAGKCAAEARMHEMKNECAVGVVLSALLFLSPVTASAAGGCAPLACNVSGTWTFQSNSTPGTLSITQIASASKCKVLNGTMDAFISNPIIGLYCPNSGRIYMGRYEDGVPFQMYQGYISSDGHTLAGDFFYWGSQGAADYPTTPWIAKR